MARTSGESLIFTVSADTSPAAGNAAGAGGAGADGSGTGAADPKSVSQVLGMEIPNYSDAELDAMEFPPGRVSQDNLRYFELKAIFDRVLAAVLLVIASPILLICVIAIRVNSPGRAIFSQRRTGAGGKTFTMYKLRSMYQDAEAKSGPQWSQPGDSRVTVVGRFLRFAHLDEIPQLINVVRGEMALVGPRPERPSIVKELIPQVSGYEKRHAVRPGITGLAQIYLPPDENVDSVKAKVVFDLIYLRYAGVVMDLRIAVCTVLRMFGLRGGLGPRWTGLTKRVDEIRQINQHRAAQRRRDDSLPAGPASTAGEQRMERLNAVEPGTASKDSGITSLIGDSTPPPHARPKAKSLNSGKRRRVSTSKPR